MKLIFYTSLLLFLFAQIIFSQIDSSTIVTEDILDDILIEPEEESDTEELVGFIEDLIRDPIDINKADVFQLSMLPEMDASSAQKIIDHRIKFGNYFSTEELFSIRDIDKTLIQKIMPFVKVSVMIEENKQIDRELTDARPIYLNSRLNIRSRFINDLQNRKGFLSDKFDGSKLKSYNRLIYKYDKFFQAGFLVEKDPGEVSYSDFSSFHLQIKDVDFINTAIAGDYILEFGQGLALWSPFGFSKGADAIFPVKKKSRGLRPYTSAAEYRYFRGTAATISINDFMLTAFYSNHTFDATIDTSTQEITSVGQTGYHRFESELNKKSASKSKIIGGVIDYRYAGLINVGVVYYNAAFSNKFQTSSLYDISGDNFNYLSTYYEINFSTINLFGEASYNGTSVASINGIQFSVNREFMFTTALRNYPRNYQNLYGFGFSERTGKINNEIGIYSGVRWKIPYGVINLYYDTFKFPYQTNENSLSSNGDELLLDFLSIPLSKFEVRLRYKYENKEVSTLIDSEEKVARRLKQIGRTEFVYNPLKSLRLRTRIEYNNFFIRDANIKENGLLVFQDFRFVRNNIAFNGRIIFFQTDSFNSALYEYENDLFGVMPNLAMYGKGIRWYLMIRYKPLNFLNVSAKYSETYKPGVSSISSGDNEITGNLDNRISFQIDFSF